MTLPAFDTCESCGIPAEVRLEVDTSPPGLFSTGPDPADDPTGAPPHLLVTEDHLWVWDGESVIDWNVQRPYGHFAVGRFAWLLRNITPLDPPVPAKGHQQLWTWDEGAAA